MRFNMRFFQPTLKYLGWLAKYAGERPVVELGCGDGYFTYAMRWYGIKALGIDPYKDPEYLDFSSFLQQRASECPIVKNTPALLIAARPDHSGWVTNVPYYMNSASELLYIGKRHNVSSDLDGITYEKIETPEVDDHITLSVLKQDGAPPNPESSGLAGMLAMVGL